MSEKLNAHESHQAHENLVDYEQQAEALKHKHEQAENARKEAAKTDVEALRRKVAEQAPKSEQIQPAQEKVVDHSYGSHHLLKKASYQQTLKFIRSRLPKSKKAFSKVIHNSTIEAVSNVSAKTVARPSGLLGGGIGAFVGSLYLLYVSKTYGFSDYNYAMFFLLFAGGFLVGLAIELMVWALWHSRKST